MTLIDPIHILARKITFTLASNDGKNVSPKHTGFQVLVDLSKSSFTLIFSSGLIPILLGAWHTPCSALLDGPLRIASHSQI